VVLTDFIGFILIWNRCFTFFKLFHITNIVHARTNRRRSISSYNRLSLNSWTWTCTEGASLIIVIVVCWLLFKKWFTI
jgi:hypothetical protein